MHGEAGIGKTALLARFAAHAGDAGVLPLWGTCYEGAAPQPYGAWVHALSGCLENAGAGELTALLAEDGGVLAQLIPSVGRRLHGLPQSPPAAPDEARLRLFDAVARLLERLEPRALLVLDDVQWADPQTLDLLVHVARFSPAASLVIAYRGARLRLTDPLAQRLGEVHRTRGTEYVRLGPLPHPEARELLEATAHTELDDELADALLGEADGNPFFLAELGRHVERAHDGGRVLPETIRGAVGLRLASISAEARRTLELASVFSAEFSFAELQALTALDEPTLLACLDEAVAGELLRATAHERYEFAHALVRHTLFDRLNPSRRARLHRRLAEALEPLAARTPGIHVREIARQYHASMRLAGAERGVPYALAAAEQARAMLAPESAAELLGIALELAAGADTAQQAAITGERAVALAEAGLGEQAVPVLERAIDLMVDSGAAPEAIADLVGHVAGLLFFASVDPIAATIERALALLGERRDIHWARLKLFARPMPWEPAGAIRVPRWSLNDPEAMRVAREHGNEFDVARAIDQLHPGTAAAAIEHLAVIERLRDDAARMYGLMLPAAQLTIVNSGPPDVAERVSRDLLALAERLQNVPVQALALICRGAALGRRGELRAALEELERSLELAARRPRNGFMPSQPVLVRGLTEQHMDPDWEALAREQWGLATDWDQLSWLALGHAALAALAHARHGDSDAARKVLDDVLPALARSEPCEYSASYAVALVAETAFTLCDAALGEQVEPVAMRLADGGAVEGYMACFELTRARLAALREDFGEAEAFFERARRTLDARGERPLRAIVDHDAAVVAGWRDGAPAIDLAQRAQEYFAELGMAVWVRRAAALTVAPQGLPDGLTAREAQILRLLAEGLTNRQIADRLVLSVHTVERHLSNAYRKIGARNRADATGHVVRRSL